MSLPNMLGPHVYLPLVFSPPTSPDLLVNPHGDESYNVPRGDLDPQRVAGPPGTATGTGAQITPFQKPGECVACTCLLVPHHLPNAGFFTGTTHVLAKKTSFFEPGGQLKHAYLAVDQTRRQDSPSFLQFPKKVQAVMNAS